MSYLVIALIKPQNHKIPDLKIDTESIYKKLYINKTSSKMGIEPGCTMKLQLPNTKMIQAPNTKILKLKNTMKPPKSWNFYFMKFANDLKRRKSLFRFLPSTLLLFIKTDFFQFSNKVCKSLSDAIDCSEL